MKTVLTLAMALALSVGCGDKKEDDNGKGGEAKPAAKSGEAKAPEKKPGSADEWADIEIPKLGLVANAPGDAKPGAFGGLSSLSGRCNPGVDEVSKHSPSFENHIQNVDAGNRGGALKEYRKKEKTSDDEWVLEYVTEKKWGYYSRKKIGDKIISCGASASNEEAHACVAKICASLKAK